MFQSRPRRDDPDGDIRLEESRRKTSEPRQKAAKANAAAKSANRPRSKTDTKAATGVKSKAKRAVAKPRGRASR